MMIGFGDVMRVLRGCFRGRMLGLWGRLFDEYEYCYGYAYPFLMNYDIDEH